MMEQPLLGQAMHALRLGVVLLVVVLVDAYG